MKPDDRKRSAGRATMRREFMELFRDTREQAASRPAPGPLHAPTPPSRFLRRFLQASPPPSKPAPSGLPSLDAHLDGGFGPGLHLLTGSANKERVAFLDSLAWEAVAGRRPVLYYALEAGAMRVWERFMAAMSAILDGPEAAVPAAGSAGLRNTGRETLARLDAALQSSVLPYVSLLEGGAGNSGSLSVFLEDLRAHAQEAAERHGRLPVVLVDDLGSLLALTGSHSAGPAVGRLDGALASDSLPGVAAAASGDLGGMDRLPVRTLMAMETPLGAAGGLGRLDLEVRHNTATGWTGVLPLLLDPASGLFADAWPAAEK